MVVKGLPVGSSLMKYGRQIDSCLSTIYANGPLLRMNKFPLISTIAISLMYITVFSLRNVNGVSGGVVRETSLLITALLRPK